MTDFLKGISPKIRCVTFWPLIHLSSKQQVRNIKIMPINEGKDESLEDGAQFSGAMDALVSKYDEIINEFTDILDKQTKKIFSDPKLDEKD